MNRIMNRVINHLPRRFLSSRGPSSLSKNPSNAVPRGGAELIVQEEGTMSIRAFGERVFRINDTFVRASVLVFPKSFLIWNAKEEKDINTDNLALLPLLFPTLEILIIGTGESMTRRLPDEFYSYFRNKGIALEVCATPFAAGIFNQLTLEGRHVAAALLTLKPVLNSDLEL